MEQELKHYGTPRHSGRYPWGSGKNPYQSGGTFTSYVSDLRKQGLSDTEIARGLGMKTTELRAQLSLAKDIQRKADYSQALALREKGVSVSEIARRMGKNESSIRSLLDPAIQQRAEITAATSNMLKDQVAEKKYLDVGLGTEAYLGVSRVKLNTAISELEAQGYKIHYVKVEQVGMPGKFTYVKVLCPPGTPYSELYKNQDKIRSVNTWSEDGGRSYLGVKTPLSIDSNKIMINYGDQGGNLKDGVIELRKGVPELSLGENHYAQVRIAVDGTHYLKGMAIYADDLPPGVDIRFNTNKKSTDVTDKYDAMKKMKDDKDNPFGSTIRQKVDSEGNVISALNIVGSKEGQGEEGGWDKWSKSISSQVLSKQSPTLAKQQLDLAYKLKEEEYKSISVLTNAAVKKQLLMKFADGADSDAVHLKAAALPRQSSKVLLPITSLKENEIYAPTYRPGETVVLIRHPHGGIFEIPSLVVNNNSKAAKAIMNNAQDAVGINPKVAEKLSGADFDGDTVIVIPNNKTGPTAIKTSPTLKALKNFDPKTAYPAYPGMPKMSNRTKQQQMGQISNLITDMTIKGATEDEIARAVKHSMVVIDAEKHHLNYKQSAKDNRISELKAVYQGGPRSGASTVVSRAKSELRVDERKERAPDPVTGARVYDYTNATYVNKKGQTVKRQETSTRMMETKDAFTLSSGTSMETVYATHANKLKALANQARKEAVNTTLPKQSPSARAAYANEVASLKSKLELADRNRPMERQAQIFANATIKQKKQENPEMDKDTLKKIKNQALAEARLRTGSDKYKIQITDREWEAIQAGAVSTNVLKKLLDSTDLTVIKQLATPRTKKGLTSAQMGRAKSLLSNGYTWQEVADMLGVSTSTLANALE